MSKENEVDKASKFIVFRPIEKSAQFSDGESVLQAAINSAIDISHSCGGFGSCGTCRVLVTSDLSSLAPRNEIESEMANDRGFADHERLGCQLLAQQGLELLIPEDKDIINK